MLSCCAGPRNDHTDPVKMRVHMAEVPEERIFENLGNVIVNKQVGKCAAKDHIGGEKQQPPGQTRMILKPPVPLFKQEPASRRNLSRECRRAEGIGKPARDTQKSRVIITAKTLGQSHCTEGYYPNLRKGPNGAAWALPGRGCPS